MRAWVPSQNGFVALPPQRQSRACVTHATVWPVPLVISRLPRTQRAVELGIDLERAVTCCQCFRLAGLGLAACCEPDLMMRVVAKRLVLRGSAPAQRRAIVRALAVEANVGAYGVRPC